MIRCYPMWRAMPLMACGLPRGSPSVLSGPARYVARPVWEIGLETHMTRMILALAGLTVLASCHGVPFVPLV